MIKNPNFEISLAIIVQNDGDYLKNALENVKNVFDEIVIVDGGSKDNTLTVAKQYTNNVYVKQFDGNFADQRNYAIKFCNKPYVFMLDADETLDDPLKNNIKEIIKLNPTIDLFLVPRINAIIDLDKNPWLVSRYGWNVNDKGYINYPDYQTRLFKNKPEIKWSGKVHERIVGFEQYGLINDMHIIHNKTCERQIKQNSFYDKLM